MEEATVSELIVSKHTSSIGREDVSMSKLCHEVSLTSLNPMPGETEVSGTESKTATSISCPSIDKMRWCTTHSDSSPVLPKRKVPLPIQENVYMVDNSDYDQPKSMFTTMRPCQSPFVEANNEPETEELLERLRSLISECLLKM